MLHLFFVDDLVLFGEATLENAGVMKSIINEFSQYFGHEVNRGKSKLFFSADTDGEIRTNIGNFLGFQITADLESYLGVPLFHTRTKKSPFQFIVDKIQSKLNGYDAKLLSLAGRIILAKSVLLSILGYFMQMAMIPIGVSECIEKIVGCFIWGSSDTCNKIPLVKWDVCCTPRETGGVGIRNIVPQNVSYLMKLAYYLVTEVDALWVRILRSNY